MHGKNELSGGKVAFTNFCIPFFAFHVVESLSEILAALFVSLTVFPLLILETCIYSGSQARDTINYYVHNPRSLFSH